jgi:Uma2 family endonuclease
MYISAELKGQMDPRHWTRADIVIEIVSRSIALYDRRTKSDTYRAVGVREMWLVDTEKREVEVQSFETDGVAIYKMTDRLSSEVLPKIEIPLTALFPDA